MTETARKVSFEKKTYERFKLNPIAGALGAEIVGIDVNKSMMRLLTICTRPGCNIRFSQSEARG